MDCSSASNNEEDGVCGEKSLENYADAESNESFEKLSDTMDTQYQKPQAGGEDIGASKCQKKIRGRPTYHDEASLFNVVSNGKASLHAVINEWIGTYKEDKDAAFLQLMQFFISSAGCKGKITTEMQNTMEHMIIIEKMTEQFGEEATEYPIVQKGQIGRKFHSSYCDFIQMLVKLCRHSIIYDQYLMDNMTSFLGILSTSKVRAFRHTATLGVMKLLSGLVRTALHISSSSEKTTIQYESEMQKSEESQSEDKLEFFRSTLEDLKEGMEELNTILAFTFKSVFVHRYKDTVPDIRSLCIEALGEWMLMYPDYFVEDSYLKYVSWMLYDKSADVRLKAVQAIRPLYADKDLIGRMQLFTAKFKDRILLMTLDKDPDVAVEAIRIISSIMNHNAEVLTEKDCECVYELVYSCVRAVGQEAGKFVCEKLLTLDRDVTDSWPMADKRISASVFFVRDLVQFFVESELPDHAVFLVDSLFDNNPAMKDWKSFTILLLDDNLPQELTLDDKHETALIKILVCCVTQAVTGEIPTRGIQPKKQRIQSRENKQMAKDQRRLTDHFAPRLPQLLKKYIADAEKLSSLLLILGHFDRGLYTQHRLEKNLDYLLETIPQIVTKHGDTAVLKGVAKSLEFLCDENFTIYQRCDTARSALLDTLTIEYSIAKGNYFDIKNDESMPDDDDTFNYFCALKKVGTFYAYHNMNRCDIWDSIFDSVTHCIEDEIHQSVEVVKCSITACLSGLLWYLNDRLIGAKDALDILKTRLDMFIATCRMILANSESHQWKQVAFSCVCDLLIAFGVQLEQEQWSSLILMADKKLQKLMNQFLREHVFSKSIHVENNRKKAEELFERRNFLASFCKLVFCFALPMNALTEVFTNYTREYDEEFGDIIKETLTRCRLMSNVDCCKTIILTLSLQFQQLQPEGYSLRRTNMDFLDLKEQSKRFASLFGLNSKVNSPAMMVLHRDGVQFACQSNRDKEKPPTNILFLELVSEFSNKLYSRDKSAILSYLDEQIKPTDTSSSGKGWQAYHSYRKSVAKDCNVRSSPSTKRARTSKHNKGERKDNGYQLDIRTEIVRPLRNISLTERHEEAASFSSPARDSQLISDFSD